MEGDVAVAPELWRAGPATDAAAVTPSDSTVLANVSGLHIGGAGVVNVVTREGNTVALTCPAGYVLPLQVTKVLSTGTTATLIVAFKHTAA